MADKGQARADTGFSLLMLRKDLADSAQIQSVKDLKGRKVVLFAKGITQHYVRGKMAKEVGLTIKDFDMTTLGAPNQLTAFETKASRRRSPWSLGGRFQDRGAAVKFRTPDRVKGLGPMQIAVMISSEKFITERRALAQRWMDAHLKGAAVYIARGSHDPEVLAILQKHTRIPAKAIRPPSHTTRTRRATRSWRAWPIRSPGSWPMASCRGPSPWVRWWT